MALKCTNNWLVSFLQLYFKSCLKLWRKWWRLQVWDAGSSVQQCRGMLFGSWFGISVSSRAALPRKRALAATREARLAVAQLVMPNRKVQLLQILHGHMCTICTWFVATQDDSDKVCPWHSARQGQLEKGRGWLLCVFCAWTVNLTLLENVSLLMSVGVDVGTLMSYRQSDGGAYHHCGK